MGRTGMIQDDETELLLRARAVRENAHAPYSGFRVGAAIRGCSGRIFVGCNVENAAYPQGTCAEAGALSAMVAAGDRRVGAVAVIADGDIPVPPCGGCRQKLMEFGAGDVVVTMAALNGEISRMTLAELLPGAFGAANLSVTGT
jgi:cytidine deaminase